MNLYKIFTILVCIGLITCPFFLSTAGNFSLFNIWQEEGGSLSYSRQTISDFSNDALDESSSSLGNYTYLGPSHDGEYAKFQHKLYLPQSESSLFEDSYLIPSGNYTSVLIYVMAGWQVYFHFLVTAGGVDFLLMDYSNYQLFSAGASDITVMYDSYSKIELGVFIDFTKSEFLYLVFYNNPDYSGTSITLDLDVTRIIEEKNFDDTLFINPETLNSSEGKNFRYLGMDISDWKLNQTVTLKTDWETVTAPIGELPITLLVDGNQTDIDCYYLECVETEEASGLLLYPSRIVRQVWVAKHSGIIIKHISNTTMSFEDNETDAGYLFYKYEVTSLNKVSYRASTSAPAFFLLSGFLALSIIVFHKKRGV